MRKGPCRALRAGKYLMGDYESRGIQAEGTAGVSTGPVRTTGVVGPIPMGELRGGAAVYLRSERGWG